MFVAPTEPPRLRDIGITSSLPEKFGVDIYWESELGKVGVQRKVFPADFLASVNDGRLQREYQQMAELDFKVLLLEGREQWTSSGALLRDRNQNRWQWDRSQHRNYLHSVSHLFHVAIAHTDNLDDTIDYLQGLRVWSDKADHVSLLRRPGPAADDPWGTVSSLAWQCHFLQGIDGVGPKLAKAIVTHFGGLPIRLAVTREELLSVDGIGPKMADKIEELLGG